MLVLVLVLVAAAVAVTMTDRLFEVTTTSNYFRSTMVDAPQGMPRKLPSASNRVPSRPVQCPVQSSPVSSVQCPVEPSRRDADGGHIRHEKMRDRNAVGRPPSVYLYVHVQRPAHA